MLTGRQYERICTALCDAYTLDDLRQLVRYELNQRLDKIVATNAALNKVVFDLVDWAEANGAVAQLVAAAAKSRPNDETLAQLAAEIGAAQSQSAEQGTLHRIDLDQQLRRGADSQPNIDTTLVTWLINRAQQTYELAKVIQQTQSTNAPRPVVCILHGNDDECHDKFVQRIVEYQLQRLIPSTALGVPQHFLLDLPACGYKSAAELHDFLRGRSGRQWTGKHGGDHSRHQRPLCYAARAGCDSNPDAAEGWSSAAHRTVADYLAFWAQWPPLAPQQWMIIFLCIRSQPKAKGLFALFGRKEQDADLGQALAGFATIQSLGTQPPAQARIICALLPQLNPSARRMPSVGRQIQRFSRCFPVVTW